MSKKQPNLADVLTRDLLAELARRVPKSKHLPPLFSPTTAESAQFAELPLRLYAMITGLDWSTESDSAVGDLIADIMHWCDHHDECSFEGMEIIDKAARYYDEEIIAEFELEQDG